MISLIVILAIVGQTFAFPATDVTEIKAEPQGSSLYQISKDSPVIVQEEKNEIQKPQLSIDHQEQVQPIKKEINSNYEAESTVEEQPKISPQPAPEISKVPESLLEYSNTQLLQLKPVTPDAVLVSNLQQPVLLPYIATSQIQPLSVVTVKEVDNINQNPAISAQEVANLVIIPTLESTKQSSAQNQLHYASTIQSPDAPQSHLNIIQSKIDQVEKSTAQSQKPVESTKVQNVNNYQTFQQKEKQVQEGIQAVSTSQEKTNTEPEDNAKQVNSNQAQSSFPIQYENGPQYQNVQDSKTAQFQVQTNSQPQDKVEQQLNEGQSSFPIQYENAPQGNNVAHYHLNQNIPHVEKTEQQLNEGQSSFPIQYENAPQGSNIAHYHLNQNIPHGDKIEQQLNEGQSSFLTQYENAPEYQNVKGSKTAQYQVETNSQPQDKVEQQLNEGQSSFPIQYENAPQGSNVAHYHLNKNIPHGDKIEQQLNHGQANIPAEYENVPQYQNVEGSQIAQYQVETKNQLQDKFEQLNQGQAVILTQYLQTQNEQVPYQQKVQSHIEPHTEEQSNQQFNIKEEIQKAQEELQQNALAQHSQDNYYQQTPKVKS